MGDYNYHQMSAQHMCLLRQSSQLHQPQVRQQDRAGLEVASEVYLQHLHRRHLDSQVGLGDSADQHHLQQQQAEKR